MIWRSLRYNCEDQFSICGGPNSANCDYPESDSNLKILEISTYKPLLVSGDSPTI